MHNMCKCKEYGNLPRTLVKATANLWLILPTPNLQGGFGFLLKRPQANIWLGRFPVLILFAKWRLCRCARYTWRKHVCRAGLRINFLDIKSYSLYIHMPMWTFNLRYQNKNAQPHISYHITAYQNTSYTSSAYSQPRHCFEAKACHMWLGEQAMLVEIPHGGILPAPGSRGVLLGALVSKHLRDEHQTSWQQKSSSPSLVCRTPDAVLSPAPPRCNKKGWDNLGKSEGLWINPQTWHLLLADPESQRDAKRPGASIASCRKNNLYLSIRIK